MNNEEISNNIAHKENEEIINNTIDTKFEKFVIFLIDDQYYAISQNLVKEIIIEKSIYYLPFVPDYIKGVINRQGEPYACIDINLLLNNKELNSNKFIIIKNPKDKMAIIITDIIKIISVNPDLYTYFSDYKTSVNFFLLTIPYENINVPVININEITHRIKNDID